MLNMVTNLRETASVADKISNGDLTVTPKPLSERDTLGIALQSMVERLRGVVGDALAAADNVSSGSQELSSSSEQLSQGATEQASSAEEASASMEEMAANIKQNADNAAQTEKIARQSSKDAEASGEAVGRAVVAMRTIAQKSPSFRKSRVRPTFWHSMPLSKPRVPVNTARASRSLLLKCASWQNAARQQPLKSPRSPARRFRLRPKPARC